MEPTKRLAAFIANTRYDALPEDLVHLARRCWLDWLGVTLGGSDSPPVHKLMAVAEALGNEGFATVLGRGGKSMDALWASRANGAAAHLLDFDDSLLSPVSVLHTTAPILPAVLALGEWRGGDGRKAILATALGIDVAGRASAAFGQSHIDRGFHSTGTAGALGAAAACTSMLGLDAERVAWAQAIAAAQASGLRAFHGTMTKSFQAGHAAACGLLAALLAERGYESGTMAYEHHHGLAAAMADGLDFDALISGLGQDWYLRRVGFKPYPCGVVAHSAIDAALEFRARGVRPEDVEQIQLEVHEHVLRATGKREIRTELDAKFSVFHCVAVALVDGKVSVEQFTRPRIEDPAVAALRERVSATVVTGLRRNQARAAATLRDGRRLQLEIEHSSGTEKNPLTDRQVAEKFHGLADPLLGRDKALRLEEQVWNLDGVERIGRIAAMAVF